MERTTVPRDISNPVTDLKTEPCNPQHENRSLYEMLNSEKSTVKEEVAEADAQDDDSMVSMEINGYADTGHQFIDQTIDVGNRRKQVGMRYLFPMLDGNNLLEKAQIWVERHNNKYFVNWTKEQLQNVDPIVRPFDVITPELYKLHMNRSEYCRNVKLKFCLESDAPWAEEFRQNLSLRPAEGGFKSLACARLQAAELWRQYSENYKHQQARYPNPKSLYKHKRMMLASSGDGKQERTNIGAKKQKTSVPTESAVTIGNIFYISHGSDDITNETLNETPGGNFPNRRGRRKPSSPVKITTIDSMNFADQFYPVAPPIEPQISQTVIPNETRLAFTKPAVRIPPQTPQQNEDMKEPVDYSKKANEMLNDSKNGDMENQENISHKYYLEQQLKCIKPTTNNCYSNTNGNSVAKPSEHRKSSPEVCTSPSLSDDSGREDLENLAVPRRGDSGYQSGYDIRRLSSRSSSASSVARRISSPTFDRVENVNETTLEGSKNLAINGARQKEECKCNDSNHVAPSSDTIWDCRNRLLQLCKDDPTKSWHNRLLPYLPLLRSQLGDTYQLPSTVTECMVDMVLCLMHSNIKQKS